MERVCLVRQLVSHDDLVAALRRGGIDGLRADGDATLGLFPPCARLFRVGFASRRFVQRLEPTRGIEPRTC